MRRNRSSMHTHRHYPSLSFEEDAADVDLSRSSAAAIKQAVETESISNGSRVGKDSKRPNRTFGFNKRKQQETPQEGYGQRKRTQFELHEVGQSSLWLDEVQFQLDTLGGSCSSDEVKQSSLLRILHMLTDACSAPTGASNEMPEYRELLTHITRILSARPLSPSTGLAVLSVLLAASCEIDGRFREGLIYPTALQEALLVLIIESDAGKGRTDNCKVQLKGAQPHLGESPAQTGAPIVDSFRRKRKFAVQPIAAGRSPITTVSADVGKVSLHSQTEETKILSTLHGRFPVLLNSFCPEISAALVSNGKAVYTAAVTAKAMESMCLLLINRYVHSKVSLLASVQTDYFTTKEDPADATMDIDNGAATKHEAGVEVEDVDVQQQDQADSDAMPDTDHTTDHALDNHAHAGALDRFQRQMRCTRVCWTSNNISSDAAAHNYFLRCIATSFASVTHSKICTPEHSVTSGNYSLENEETKSRVWLLLGIIEAACFRCPANQDFLARMLIPNAPAANSLDLRSSTGTPSKNRTSETQSRPSIIVTKQSLHLMIGKLFHDLGLELLRHHWDCDNEYWATSGRFPPFLESAHESSAELRKLCNLFPELPTTIRQQMAPRSSCLLASPMDFGTGADWVEDEVFSLSATQSTIASNCETPATRNSQQSVDAAVTSNEEIVDPSHCVTVRTQEIFTASLKALCSLSNDCPLICNELRSYSAIEISATSKGSSWSFMEYLISLLAWCGVRRMRSLRVSGREKNLNFAASATLTPEETSFERFIFDTELSLLSLLTNIIEAEVTNDHKQLLNSSSSGHDLHGFISKVSVISSVAHFPVINKAVEAVSSSIDGDALRRLCSFHHRSSVYDVNWENSNSVVDLLIGMLHLETQIFIDDLYATDDAINDSSAGMAATDQQQSAAIEAGGEELPVAELIIAAFISLMLFVISKMEFQSQHDIGLYIRKKLPGGTWWLCIRVLKAFLSLQGHTGVMLLENISLVLLALKSMATEQGSDSSSNHAANARRVDMGSSYSTAADEGIVTTKFEDTWWESDEPSRCCAMKTKNSRTDGRSRSSGDWIWDGKDFVWKAQEQECNEATSSSPHAESSSQSQSSKGSAASSRRSQYSVGASLPIVHPRAVTANYSMVNSRRRRNTSIHTTAQSAGKQSFSARTAASSTQLLEGSSSVQLASQRSDKSRCDEISNPEVEDTQSKWKSRRKIISKII